MFKKVLESLAIFAIAATMLGVFTFMGVLLLPFMILGLSTLVILAAVAWLSSLFSRSKATRGREREENSE